MRNIFFCSKFCISGHINGQVQRTNPSANSCPYSLPFRAAPAPALASDLRACNDILKVIHSMSLCRAYTHSLALVYCAPSKCPCTHLPGLFCGNRDETWNSHCTNGHVFECDGSTAAFLSCDFGTTWSCIKCSELECDSRPWTGY